MDRKSQRIQPLLVLVLITMVGTMGFPAGDKEGAGPITVRAATQKHPAVDALKELLPGFEAGGYSVELSDIPQDQLNSRVRLSLSAQTDEFDVIMLGHMLIPQYRNAGWIVSLSDFIDDPQHTNPQEFQFDDILGGFVNAASVDGELYAMPFYGESTMLMYNKEMFAAAGLDQPPQTFEELESYARRLTDKAGNQFGIAMRGRRGINWYPWSGFAYGMGGGWIDSAGRPILNTPETIEATELFSRLISEYGPPGAANFDWNDVQIMMQQGDVAMIIDATNFGPRLENPDDSTVVGQVGYAMVPRGPAGRFPSIYSAALSIPETSSEKDAAWEFLKWSTSTEIQLESAMMVDRLDVTRRSVWNHPDYRERYQLQEMIDTTVTAMDEAIAEYLPRIPEFGDFANILGLAINRVITGDNAATAMADAEAELEAVLK